MQSGGARRLVVLGFPARGHTNPSLRLVERLITRGMAVDYWSVPHLRQSIEATGARFRPYPEQAAGLLATRSFDTLLMAVAQLAPDLLAYLHAPIAGRRPGLVISDSLSIWGPPIAARLAVPLVASVTTFAFNRGLLRALGADALLQPWQWEAITNALSRRDPEGRDFGRPADILVPKGMLKLVYTSREFQIGGASLDRTHLFIGPMLNPPAASPADGQRRLIYASLGTWSNRHATFFETCLACFSDGTRPVLISLGDGLRPEQFGQIPPNLRLASFVEQTSVLGATGLFITHGGMNSVSEALIYGVPMILVPQDADQLLVAKRVEQLGAGLVIGKDEFSPEALARCVEHIDRHRDGFVTRSRRLGRGFASASEQSAMLDRILALAGRPETHTVATGSSNDG